MKPIISLYEETVLTPKESVLFVDLKNNISELSKENSNIKQNESNNHQNLSLIKSSLQEALTTLSAMSEIQVVVGKELREQTEASIKSSVMSSQFEVALLVIIALIIQALIFASKTVQSKLQHQSHLN